eukprot:56068_1
MKNRDALTNININISQNIQTWNCKCCGQPDIQDTKFECTRCHSLKSESLFNVDSNNKYIVSGYCRAENECPAVICKLVANYLTFQKFKFKITWSRNEIHSILYTQNKINPKVRIP